MARSTQAQTAQRLNAAYRLLSHETNVAQAAARLARKYRISLRHAYRYLAEAAQLEGPVAVAEPALPITFKVSASAIRALRAYAADHDATLSEVVTRAITAYVTRAHSDG